MNLLQKLNWIEDVKEVEYKGISLRKLVTKLGRYKMYREIVLSNGDYIVAEDVDVAVGESNLYTSEYDQNSNTVEDLENLVFDLIDKFGGDSNVYLYNTKGEKEQVLDLIEMGTELVLISKEA
ncbi:hypothetical protein [Oceanobacillus kimchii]|uniref:Uncharacterized protein n=1 Tax=Oceanobacillus kimchii TaxID=746691 RepID=A0ABQ5TKU9_9BACI|nr:hypothetical protein [Oceanobacillus kimchii]GLO66214.1 hypothetical protein MACH08_19980 [Oceanobacillus kimchii]